MNRLNANNMAVNPEILQAAISRSGLRWKLHPAQMFGIEAQGFRAFTEFSRELKPEEAFASLTKTVRILCGIPVELSGSMPDSSIELWADEALLFTIERLGIPMAFAATP